MPKIKKEVIVVNESGLHARPSCVLAKKAKEFDGTTISISKETMTVNAADVLELLMLGATCGTKLMVEADGIQAQEALDKIDELFKNKFYVKYK